MAGRRYLLTVIIIAGCLAGWLVLLTASSAAHSNLVRSDPPENAQLTTAPKQVQLWFSEAPELKLSDVQVVTPQRKRIDAGDLHLAPGDPTSLIISLRDTPVGTYAVIWQATSAVDGHITKGVFAFSYGNQPAGATESVLESLAVSSPPVTLRPDDAVVRWINLVGMSLFTGALAFYPLILAPLFKRSDADATPYLPLVRNRTRRLALTGAGLMLAGTLLSLLMQALEISGASILDFGALLDPILRVLTESRYGVIWFVRIGLILLSLALIWRLPVPQPRTVPVRSQQALGFQAPVPAWVVAPESSWWLGVLFGLLILLMTSLNSHAAATSTFQPFSAIADWVHLVCAALWIGGLAQMGLMLPVMLKRTAPEKRMHWLALIIGLFSQLGIVCVTGLVITGIYAAWLEVGTLDGLWTTLYGATLVVKLVIILPLVALAAINLLLLRPAVNGLATAMLKNRNNQPVQSATLNSQLSTFNHFKLVVRGESLLALLVLLVVGFMTGLPPSKDVAAGKTQYENLTLSNGANALVGKTGHYGVELNITPGGTGANDFSLSVVDANNSVPTNIEKAVMRFTYQGSDTGTQEVELAQDSPGSYHAQGSYLSLDGEWWLDVLVRPNGGDYEQVRFDLKVAPGSVTTAVPVKPALQVGPAPAKSGIPEQLRLTLQDDKGAPVTDATITLEEIMPAHAHILDTTLRHSGGGVYVGSSVFPMSGQWIIVAKIIRSDGSGFERQWELDVQD